VQKPGVRGKQWFWSKKVEKGVKKAINFIEKSIKTIKTLRFYRAFVLEKGPKKGRKKALTLALLRFYLKNHCFSHTLLKKNTCYKRGSKNDHFIGQIT